MVKESYALYHKEFIEEQEKLIKRVNYVSLFFFIF
jgi:hypothetical protein